MSKRKFANNGEPISEIDQLALDIASNINSLCEIARSANGYGQLEQLRSGKRTSSRAISDVRKEDAAAIRHYLLARRLRERQLPPKLFSDPAWDILLDLHAAFIEKKSVSISSACIASGVPDTTALRWLSDLEKHKLVKRHNDTTDGRRKVVKITLRARKAVNLWLDYMWPLQIQGQTSESISIFSGWEREKK